MANIIDSRNSLSADWFLNTLEHKEYLKSDSFEDNFTSDEGVLKKLTEFNYWLSGLGATRLSKVGKDEANDCYYILKNLKKNISHAISRVARLHGKDEHNYICSICGEIINIDAWADTWEVLQSHEHFEELYVDFISGKLVHSPIDRHCKQSPIGTQKIPPSLRSIDVNTEPKSVTAAYYLQETMKRYRDLNTQNSNNAALIRIRHDSPSGYSDNKSISSLSTNTARSPSHSNDAVNGVDHPESSSSKPENNFKFNFAGGYDKNIEATIYSDTLMKVAKTADGLDDYTLQKTGPNRAICLICVCELKHTKRISKQIAIEHVHGQRHLRNCSHGDLLSALSKYHEAFKKKDIVCQAHTVYFVPHSNTMAKCTLCNAKVGYQSLESHIASEKHKKKVVVTATQTKLGYGCTFYMNIIDIQLNDYKITIDAVTPNKNKDSPTDENKKANAGTPKKISKSTPGSSSAAIPKHNPIKSVKNPTGNEVDDLIPNRYRAQLEFFTKIDNVFRCKSCQVVVEATTLGLKHHIALDSHLICSQTKLPKYRFYCEICNSIYLDEKTWNVHFEENGERHAAMAESRKENVTEYECQYCKMVIFGDDISLIRHAKENKIHKTDIVMPSKVRDMFISRESITATGSTLRIEADKILDEQDPTFICCEALEKVLSVMYPDCKAYPFGSRISGLGCKDSDLDVFLDTGDMYLGTKNQDTRSQIVFVTKCKSVFSREKNRDEFTHIVPIPSARTPIIKLWHRPSDLDCDISFRHGLSVENTIFLKYCIKVQPQLQMLVLILKKWSSYCGFCEHITTYAFAMLSVFYLQVRNYLPPVVLVRKLNPTPPKVIDGWEGFDDTLPPEQLREYIQECTDDLTKLLEDFFAYYMQFDYKKDVVCPLLGRTIEKELFTPNGVELPEEMVTYINKLNIDKNSEMFRSRSEFCIQDPFDLTHNLTKACPQYVVSKFKRMCEISFDHLKLLK